MELVIDAGLVLEEFGFRRTSGGGFITSVSEYEVSPHTGRERRVGVWELGAVDRGEEFGAHRWEVLGRWYFPGEEPGAYRAAYAPDGAAWIALAVRVMREPREAPWGRRH